MMLTGYLLLENEQVCTEFILIGNVTRTFILRMLVYDEHVIVSPDEGILLS